MLGAGVFLCAFALYLWTLPPSLAPYRDAGEMAASTATLGVSHPPSYPVYILAGRAFGLLPLATHAYRLNLLSAAAGALALAVLACAVLPATGLAGALSAVLALGLSTGFWDVCRVQEMYSLMLLFALILLLLALRREEKTPIGSLDLFFFLAGFFLGNRTDLLLWMPGLLLLLLGPSGRWRDLRLLRAAGFGLLGLSIYLYLPLRSMQGPLLDWNHPAVLWNFIGSLTRRGYGGTLDLLSKSYATGENFLPNLRVYGGHLWEGFGPAGLLLCAFGVLDMMKSSRNRRCAGLGLLYGASGPLFLFLANMPPNPHALAIVAPHYLLSDLVLAVFVAEGAASLIGRIPTYASEESSGLKGSGLRVAGASLLLGMLVLQAGLMGRWAKMDRRWDLTDYDYVHNVMRSAPKDAVVLAKKDVQLFSLWYFQRAEGLRPDVRLVGQGISHSPWYQHAGISRYEKPVQLGPLRGPEDFDRFLAGNEGSAVFATTDVDIPPGRKLGPPRGLLMPFSPKSGLCSIIPWEFLVFRGDLRCDKRPDFFSEDLVEAYAVSFQRLGSSFMEVPGREAEAKRFLLKAWGMRWLLPDAPVVLGFLAHRAGDPAAAFVYYSAAARIYDRLLELTEQYRSLPEVKESIRISAAETVVNLGVAAEKSGKKEEARAAYQRALALNPLMAKAHYDLAVLDWGTNWDQVVYQLQEALRVDPGYVDAQHFLPAALSLRDRSRRAR
jgi:tetratricopeptide (TPR) repeat protein